uniref:Eukaryotic translation initiation factor 3 subunit A n=1 Tax=Blastobotrys adeninivorans TaxID=409370 RepID=A0A060TIM1_BLAAD
MAPFARPENVLKRADELIAVDQSPAALELLYETISSKRSRNVSQAFLEPIMLRFVELSVALRKGKVVKDGLHQYKKIVQMTTIGSLEVVVKKFLELSEAKVAEAQATAQQIVIDADEDLEAADSPEDLLMSTVSSEQNKDRTDREVVTPWLKFLWEAYRSTLDVLRNNSRLEVLYKQVVRQAFDFCLKFTRKTEFRRLCELLRGHLQTAAAQAKASATAAGSTQPNPIDLSDPDTLQRYLDTRFEQLTVAVKLELWQEAFRSVEDVHTLLTVSKRPAKVSTMANYYENVARIFIVSGNHLFHAAAWSRFYSLVLQARSVPESELTRIASLLLLSALSIPTFSQQSRSGLVDQDEQKHRNTRLTGLLNLAKTPSREMLIKSALAKNVLSHVRPEIRELYKVLEVEFHPLSIKSRLEPLINKIGSDETYKPYIKPLYQVILTRLFQQLSQVYKTVKLDFVIDLATFPAPFDASAIEIEKFIVAGCQKGEFAMRLDHVNSSITFVDHIYDASPSPAYGASLQATPAEIIRTQLSRLGKSLHTAVATVDPVYINEQARIKNAARERAATGLARENARILARQDLLETRKKEAEAEAAKREEEEAKARALRIQQEQLAEQQRLAEDHKRRELERIKRENDAIRENEKRKLAEEINSKGIIKIDVNNLEDLDTQKLRTLQVQQLAKETQDLNERLRIIGRRMDHLERAYRMEEVPIWEQDAEAQQARDKKVYEARNQAVLTNSKVVFEERLALKNRLERIVPDYVTLRKDIDAKHAELLAAQKAENEKKLAEAKARRVEEFRQRREREYREKKEREEAERRRAEEEARRAEEERNKPQAYRPGMLRGGRTASASASPPPSSAPAPAAAPEPRKASNPFGAARPVETKIVDTTSSAARKSNPFGAARPVDTKVDAKPEDKPAPKPGRYIPPSLRNRN